MQASCFGVCRVATQFDISSWQHRSAERKGAADCGKAASCAGERSVTRFGWALANPSRSPEPKEGYAWTPYAPEEVAAASTDPVPEGRQRTRGDVREDSGAARADGGGGC